MKKVLSILTVFVLIFSLLTGCGVTDNEKAVGKWEGVWDLSTALNSMLTENMEDDENYFNFDDFKLKVVFDFTEDGTLKVAITEDSIKAAFESLKEDLKEGLRKMYQKLIDDNKYNMTVDELLAQTNLSLDQLVEQAFSQASLESVYEGIESESDYNLIDGKLYGDGGFFSKSYITYEFSGDTLVLKELVGEADEQAKTLFPLTLAKVE